MAKTVIGLFDEMSHAQMAVRELVDNGFRREDISLMAADRSGDVRQREVEGRGEDITEGAVSGAGVGAVLGGIGGLLVGLGALAIPGIGPIVAAGPLAAALGGAGIGAVTGGVVGALVDLGLPEDEANMYVEGVRRGGTLVAVRTADNMADHAAQILDRHNPIDIRRRSQKWRSEGWRRFDPEGEPFTFEHRERTGLDPTMHGERETTIPTVEEDMRIGKREVERGGVRVETSVEEEPVEETIRLREEHVDVERRPVDRPASEADWDAALRDRTIEVTEHGEEPVIQKEARVVEEVSVHKDVDERDETVRGTVRRTDVHTEEIDSRRRGRMEGFDMYEGDLRQHYDRTFSSRGYRYEDVRPAYMYGYNLRRESDCNGDCRWEDIELQARHDWERTNPNNPWEEFKDAVQEGWNALTGR